MPTIRPSELPAATGTLPVNSAIVTDVGATVAKATPAQIVDAAIPLASQAEAENGADNTKRVTPLRVKQAIEAIGFTQDRLAQTDGASLVGVGSARLNAVIPFTPQEKGALGTNTPTASDRAAFLAALTQLANNNYSGARGLTLPGGSIYRLTTSALAITLAHSSFSMASDGKATLVADDMPNGAWLLDVDYLSGATFDFPTFNLSSIALAALAAPRFGLVNGIKTKRVLGSKFTQVEFNNLNVACELNDDTNLNTFDTCMWRGNVNAVKTTSGAANENIYLNCQWRYHTGTALDFTGTDGNKIIGGDFEPNNFAPFLIADHLKAVGVRAERNGTNGDTGVIALDENDLEFNVHSDGATQLTPFVEVQGDNNRIVVRGRSGTGAVIKAGTINNRVDLSNFRTLIAPFAYLYTCEDAEPTNVLIIGASMQGNGTVLSEGNKAQLVPADLTLWTASAGTTFTNLADGGQRINWGANGSLTYTPPAGTYYEIMVAVTAIQSNANSQPILSISNGPAATDMQIGNGVPGFLARRLIATRSQYTTPDQSDTPYNYVNPVFTIKPANQASASGLTSTIYNLRTSANGRLPE